MLLSPSGDPCRQNYKLLPPVHCLLLVLAVLLGHTDAQALECNEGFYYNTAQGQCRPCLTGTYKSDKGPHACVYCPKDANGRNSTTLGDGHSSMDECYFRPYVLSVVPRYGPLAGGTRVNITLAYLTNQKLTRVRFNHLITTRCVREASSFLCYTPGSSMFMSGPVDVEMMDSKSEYLAKSPKNYTYMPNPSIELVENPKTILSGGILITVRGQHLTSVAQPEMVVTRIYKKNNTKEFPSDCQVTNSTLMLCPTPTLQNDDILSNQAFTGADDFQKTRRRRQAEKSGEPLNNADLEYRLGFKFDGMNTFDRIRNISVFQDPVYKKFPGKHALKYYHASRHTHVAIRGERLDYSVTLTDIDVRVGTDLCIGLSLVTNLLTCQPPASSTRHGTRGPGPERSHYVQVTVGNLRFHIGYLKYVNEELAAKEVILGMSLLGVLLLWVIVATAVIVWWQRCRHNRRKQQRKSPQTDTKVYTVGETSPRSSASSNEAENFLFAGNGSSNNSDDTVTTGVPSLEVEVVENVENAQMVHIDIWSVLEEPLKSKVKECQIDSHRLTLGECIGVGSFGRVFKGEMDAEDGSKIPVAVKTLRGKYWCVTSADAGAISPGQLPPLRVLGIPSAALWAQSDPTSRIITKYGFTSADELPQFLEEGLIMAGFRHEHILPLYGVAVSDCLPFVVSEFMDLGDLRSYVRTAPEESISVKACLGLSLQVAEGMVYLSQQGFLHRDLAARNCLINSNTVVKIGDFGLSRDLHGQDYYRVGDMGRPLPVKWMAIESLNLGKFSTKSDVWSFGIVMWELLTKGRTPYRTVNNIDLKDYLNNDNRLSKPIGSPDKVYDIMVSCWRVNPAERPTFEDLVIALTDVTGMDDVMESNPDVSIVQIEQDVNHDFNRPDSDIPGVNDDYILPIDSVVTAEDNTRDVTAPVAVTNEASKPDVNNEEKSPNIARSGTSDVTAQPQLHIVTDAVSKPDVTDNEGCSDIAGTPNCDEVNSTDAQLLLA